MPPAAAPLQPGSDRQPPSEAVLQAARALARLAARRQFAADQAARSGPRQP